MMERPPTNANRSAPDKPIDFDDYSSGYDELLRESTKQFTDDIEFFSRYKIDLVKERIKHPVRRVLEYGCGIGRNIPYLASAFPGAEIVGTDVSAASLEAASKMNPDARFKVEQGELDIGTFDLIFVASVFHHIPLDQRIPAMATLFRRLAKQGELFVFEHNPYNPVTRRIVSTCPFDADAILLKPAELVALFDSAGIKPTGKSFCLFVPPKLSWLSPIERFLTWLPLGGQYWVQGVPK
jgi:SAM-dependent methyltransferase